MSSIDDYNYKREIVLGLLMQVGALSSCPIHDEIIDGPHDVEGAYKLAMSIWARGEHDEFESAREFTDYIKDLFEEYADTECGACANVRDA